MTAPASDMLLADVGVDPADVRLLRHQDVVQGRSVYRLCEASDYRVSILETVGSGATETDILAAETRWKAKLQSREIGLNRN